MASMGEPAGKQNRRVTRGLPGKLALVVVSCAGSLVIMECLVRWILPVYDPRGMLSYYVGENGVPLARKDFTGRQRKNTGDYDVSVRINQYGFRDSKDLSQSTREDLFVVGDSFSIGHGVEERERYSDLLENLLGRKVYNISIPTDIAGYDRLVAYAEEHGAAIQNLLVAVCMENDLRDYEEGGALKRSRFRQAKAFLTAHSAVYNAMTTIVHENSQLNWVASRTRLIAADPMGLDSRFCSRAVESSVERLVAMLERHKIANAIVIVIPSRGLWRGNTRQIQAKIHDDFVGLLRSHGLRIIDLRRPFEEGGAPLEYHFKNDGHWNAKGHLKAAVTICRYLMDNGWARSDCEPSQTPCPAAR